MFTIADLDSAIPAATITEPTPGTIQVAIPADNVAEFVQTLLEGCATAQTAYNTANPNAQIDAFPSPAPGLPVRQDDGTDVVTYSYTVSIDAPVNRGSATASRV